MNISRSSLAGVLLLMLQAPAIAGPGAYNDLIRRASQRYQVSELLIREVMRAESSFNPNALSEKGAIGLMQLMPATAARFGVRNPWVPEQNITGGTAYLRWLLDHFNGDVRLTLAGYNAGEKAVERHRGVPPYRETQRFVKKIIKRLKQSGYPVPQVEAGRLTSPKAGFTRVYSLSRSQTTHTPGTIRIRSLGKLRSVRHASTSTTQSRSVRSETRKRRNSRGNS